MICESRSDKIYISSLLRIRWVEKMNRYLVSILIVILLIINVFIMNTMNMVASTNSTTNIITKAIENPNIWFWYIAFNGTHYYVFGQEWNDVLDDYVYVLWILDQKLNTISTKTLPYSSNDWILGNAWRNYVVVYSENKKSIDVLDASTLNIVKSFNISEILSATKLSIWYLDVMNGVIVLIASTNNMNYTVFMDIYNQYNVIVKTLSISPSYTYGNYIGIYDYTNNRIIYPAYYAPSTSVFYPSILEVYVSRSNSNINVDISNIVISIQYNTNNYIPSIIGVVYDGHYYYLVIPYKSGDKADVIRYDPDTNQYTLLSTIRLQIYSEYRVNPEYGVYYLDNNIYVLSSVSGLIDIYDMNMNLLNTTSIEALLGIPQPTNPIHYIVGLNYPDRIILSGSVENITTGTIYGYDLIANFIIVFYTTTTTTTTTTTATTKPITNTTTTTPTCICTNTTVTVTTTATTTVINNVTYTTTTTVTTTYTAPIATVITTVIPTTITTSYTTTTVVSTLTTVVTTEIPTKTTITTVINNTTTTTVIPTTITTSYTTTLYNATIVTTIVSEIPTTITTVITTEITTTTPYQVMPSINLLDLLLVLVVLAIIVLALLKATKKQTILAHRFFNKLFQLKK